MSNSQFEEQQVEELLKRMPKQQDHRSKEEFFQQLKQTGIFNEDVKAQAVTEPAPLKNNMKRKRNLTTIIAAVSFTAVAATAFFFINNPTNDESAFRNDTTPTVTPYDQREEEQNPAAISNMRMLDGRTGLYTDELSNEYVFTIGFVGQDAESIPASFKLPEQWLVTHDIKIDGQTYLNVYKQVASLIDEEGYSYLSCHPLMGELEEEGDVLIHYLPENHPFDEGTASFGNYIGVMKHTFGQHYKALRILQADGSPAELSHFGIVTEDLDLSVEQTAYFKYEAPNGIRYLVPNMNVSYASIEKAMTAMKNSQNDLYATPFVEGVNFEHEVANDELVITFKEALDVAMYEPDALMTMLESIIFTAKSFGLSVRFDNVTQPYWNGLDFTQSISSAVFVNEHFVAF